MGGGSAYAAATEGGAAAIAFVDRNADNMLALSVVASADCADFAIFASPFDEAGIGSWRSLTSGIGVPGEILGTPSVGRCRGVLVRLGILVRLNAGGGATVAWTVTSGGDVAISAGSSPGG